MHRESVNVPGTCPNCGAAHSVTYTVTGGSEGLRFALSFFCPECRHAIEGDGRCIPEDVRPHFYSKNGKWTLRLTDMGAQKLKLLHTLREVMGMGIAEAGDLLKSLPRQLAEGTHVEMEVLKERFLETGALLVVERDKRSLK